MSGKEYIYNDVYNYAVEAGWKPEDTEHGINNIQMIEICNKVKEKNNIDLNISQSQGSPELARSVLRDIGATGQKTNVIILINDRNAGPHYVNLKEYKSDYNIVVYDSNATNHTHTRSIFLKDVQAIIY